MKISHILFFVLLLNKALVYLYPKYSLDQGGILNTRIKLALLS